MKIGLLSPSIYMSPKRYGDMIFAPRDLSMALADGLVEKGHEVYFFTTPDIQTKAHIIGGDTYLLEKDFVEEKLVSHSGDRLKWASFYTTKRNYEMDLTERCYKMAREGKLDIIHSYHDTLAHFLQDLTGFPTVYTLHDPLPKNTKSLTYWLLNKFSHQNYVSISNAFRYHEALKLNFISTVYHGIASQKYTPSFSEGSFLGFIGRMAPEKGIEFAIDAAKAVGMSIRVATSTQTENINSAYYEQNIKKRLDPSFVLLTGFMNDIGRNKFLSQATCLLFPIQWEEPFGMVLIEAMASGTPVVAFARGSVPEIVVDGKTGFLINPSDIDIRGKWIVQKTGIDGLIEAIRRIGEIDRKACRKHVEENFTIEKMVAGYEEVYKKVIEKK
ncbi:MAG: glycosyltransferase family 4 protein [Candidatus Levybacteria bacterium]|nr:glycosyltransferase family 4 protein [Candidatus Levybacteria bacterium]